MDDLKHFGRRRIRGSGAIRLTKTHQQSDADGGVIKSG